MYFKHNNHMIEEMFEAASNIMDSFFVLNDRICKVDILIFLCI